MVHRPKENLSSGVGVKLMSASVGVRDQMLTTTTYWSWVGPVKTEMRYGTGQWRPSSPTTNPLAQARGVQVSESGPSPASPASARARNLSRLLTLTHREGPQSRAALTRRTGLNRSTIGGLVAELAALGLVS